MDRAILLHRHGLRRRRVPSDDSRDGTFGDVVPPHAYHARHTAGWVVVFSGPVHVESSAGFVDIACTGEFVLSFGSSGYLMECLGNLAGVEVHS